MNKKEKKKRNERVGTVVHSLHNKRRNSVTVVFEPDEEGLCRIFDIYWCKKYEMYKVEGVVTSESLGKFQGRVFISDEPIFHDGVWIRFPKLEETYYSRPLKPISTAKLFNVLV